MVEIFQHHDFQTLQGLRLRRREASAGLAKLREEYEHVSRNLRDKSEALRLLTAEYAVAEQKLRRTRNELFSLRKKCAGVDDSFLSLQRQIEAYGGKHADLVSKKRRIETDIVRITDETAAIAGVLDPLREKRKALARDYQDRWDLRRKMTQVLEQALSNTSLKREEVEKELADLNENFMAALSERSRISDRLSRVEASSKGMRESVGALENRKEVLVQAGEFQQKTASLGSSIKTLRERLQTAEEKAGGLEQNLEARRKEFDELTLNSEKRKQEISRLQSEVFEYEKALDERQRAEKWRADTYAESERLTDQLGFVFTGPVQIRSAAKAVEKTIEGLEQVLGRC